MIRITLFKFDYHSLKSDLFSYIIESPGFSQTAPIADSMLSMYETDITDEEYMLLKMSLPDPDINGEAHIQQFEEGELPPLVKTKKDEA